MSLQFTNNDTMKSVVEIFASASREEQKRMLRVLRYEKARLLARKLDRLKPRVKRTDKQIAEAIHRIRKSYGANSYVLDTHVWISLFHNTSFYLNAPKLAKH